MVIRDRGSKGGNGDRAVYCVWPHVLLLNVDGVEAGIANLPDAIWVEGFVLELGLDGDGTWDGDAWRLKP